MRSYIHFFTLPNFEFIETINVKLMDQNRLIQINDNEILIVAHTNCLKIIDINNCLVELDNDIDYYYDYQYYGDEIICLSQLKNGTIIACLQNGINFHTNYYNYINFNNLFFFFIFKE